MKRFLSLMLCISLLIFAIPAAQAAMMVKDGLEISLTTDKSAYEAGERIDVNLSIANQSGADVNDLSITFSLPEGYVAADGTALTEEAGVLAANQTLSLSTHFIATGKALPALPQTGDSTPLFLLLALALLSGAALVKMQPETRRRFFSLLLCVILLGSLLPEKIAAAAEMERKHTAVISQRISVGGESVALSAVLEYMPGSDGKASLTAPKGITQKTTATGKCNISWKAVSGADGYEVFYATPSRETFKKYASSTSLNLTMSSLNANFTWIKIKVRAYKLVNGKRQYGPYSSVFTANPVSVRRLYIFEETFSNGLPSISTYTQDLAKLNALYDLASPFARRPIKTNKYKNQTKAKLKTRISEMAALADKNDVTIVYLSAHGDNSVTSGVNAGRLILSDGSQMTFQELAASLKNIAGRVVVMLDSSGSGSAINKSSQQASELIKAFAAVDEKLPSDGDTILEKSGELQLDKFYIIAATSSGSERQYDAGGSYLTMYLEDAFLSTPSGKWQADANGDNTITLGELETFMQGYAAKLQRDYGGYYMSPQVYPTNSTFPIFRSRLTTSAATRFNAANANLANGLLQIPGDAQAGASYTLNITSSHAWTVEMADQRGSEWIALNKTSGANGSTTLEVTLKKLPPADETYKTKLTFTCNGQPFVYSVQMKGEECVFEYTIANGEVTIVRYLKNAENVVVPEKIEGCPVTKIGPSVFEGNTTIKSINLPDTIEVIGARAFYGCTNLTTME